MPRDVQKDSGSWLELYPDRANDAPSRRLPLRVEDLDAR